MRRAQRAAQTTKTTREQRREAEARRKMDAELIQKFSELSPKDKKYMLRFVRKLVCKQIIESEPGEFIILRRGEDVKLRVRVFGLGLYSGC